MSAPWRAVLWLALCAAAPVAASTPAGEGVTEQQLNEWIREGVERPRAALARLDAVTGATGSVDARALVLARGLVHAYNGQSREAGIAVLALGALLPADPLAPASAHLIQAVLAAQEGFGARAAVAAQAALDVFGPPCDAGKPRPACDPWAASRSRRVIFQQALTTRRFLDAQTIAQQGMNVARALADSELEARAQLDLALAAAHRRDRAAATLALGEAQRLVQENPTADLRAAAALASYEVAALLGDPVSGARAAQDALRVIDASGKRLPRAQLLLRRAEALSDARQGSEAVGLLAAAEPVFAASGDRRALHRALDVRGVTLIRGGDVAGGRRVLAEVQAFWRATESDADLVRTLRRQGSALADVGEPAAALALFHQERGLGAEINRASVAATQDAQRHEQDLLTRDNAIKAEALVNAEQTQRIILLVIAVLALSGALVALLYRRVSQANRQLVASRSRLQRASERDPLTDLANRRHFQHAMKRLGADSGLRGALLLVDIDHFKVINDTHGHSRGDEVIVEVARRLTRVVRAGEWVARWGGEEFLLFSGGASAQDAQHMAQRILASVGGTPIGDLTVTVSLGFGSFPLPPHGVAIGWEPALALIDQCLYAAKRGGRNRAVGLVWAQADSAPALHGLADDLAAASEQGSARLLTLQPPT